MAGVDDSRHLRGILARAVLTDSRQNFHSVNPWYRPCEARTGEVFRDEQRKNPWRFLVDTSSVVGRFPLPVVSNHRKQLTLTWLTDASHSVEIEIDVQRDSIVCVSHGEV
jgi:hypothetical protein